MSKRSGDKRLDRIPKRFREPTAQTLREIKEKLRARREGLEMTQEQLAEAVNVGVKTIQAIEQGGSQPSIELLIALVKALDVKLTIQ